MSTLIVLMVLVSAGLHPLREFFIKGDSTPEGVTLAVIFFFGVFSTIQVFATGVDPWTAVEVWPLALVSSLAILGYYLCIVATLRHGDFSVYYPITRSSPLFVVVVGWFILDLRYSVVLLAGVALVLVGAFLLQYRPGSRLFSEPRALVLAVLALSAHGVLTLADAEAMKTVGPAEFLFLQYLFIVPAIAVMFSVTRPRGRSVYGHLFIGWIQTPIRFLIAGSTSYLSYYLILMTFQMGANVVAVASLRQVSIPISVILGGLILKESRMQGRLVWSGFLAVGVVFVILSK